MNGRGVARARRCEHSCCTRRSTGHLSTLGPYCRARASNVPSREPEFASEYQTKWDSGVFLSHDRSRSCRKVPNLVFRKTVRLLGRSYVVLQEILLFGLVFRHSFKWASSQSQHARRRCGLACARRGRDYCMLFTARASQLYLPLTTPRCLDATVNIGGVVAQSAERL